MSSTTEERRIAQDSQQRKTFTRWVYSQLDGCPIPEKYQDRSKLDDVMGPSFSDGVLLANLSQSLTKMKTKISNNTNELFSTTNISQALDNFEKDGCELVNIHASSIYRADEKAVMGLIWQLIQFYLIGAAFQPDSEPEPEPEPVVVAPTQPSQQTTNIPKPLGRLMNTPMKSSIPPKKRSGNTINLADVRIHILEFVNTQIGTLTHEIKTEIINFTQHQDGLVCTNLSTEWQNPGLMLGLVCSLCPPNQETTLKNIKNSIFRDENEENAPSPAVILDSTMIYANEHMQINKLLDGLDMTHSVDQNSMVTYLSYYIGYSMKPKEIIGQKIEQKQQEIIKEDEKKLEQPEKQQEVMVKEEQEQQKEEKSNGAEIVPEEQLIAEEVQVITPVVETTQEEEVQVVEKVITPEVSEVPSVTDTIVIQEVPVEKIIVQEVPKIVIQEIPIEKIVEVIKEVPVEKIVEVIKEVPVEKIVIQEVQVEKIVEVIKEVPVEKIVEKIVEKEVIREVKSDGTPIVTPENIMADKKKEEEIQRWLIIALIIAILAFILK